VTRIFYLAIAISCYAAFFVSFVYFVGFVGACPGFPMTVDKGIASGRVTAALIDLALIALFGLQHSIMARPKFKAMWTRIVPVALERSIYCLAAALALGVMFVFWHPISGMVWHITNPIGRTIIWTLFWLGFGLVFISTWLINHFELFGLAQVWRNLRGNVPVDTIFRTPLFYRLVRHPIYSGFTLAIWATPDMSVGHVLFAAGMTLYILIGIAHEEKDLIAYFGEQYVQYRARVGMLVPWLGRRQSR
jgi:methanethiol S-methyltransferase